MMQKLKKLIDDCTNFELTNLEENPWKIEMIQPYIDNYTIDE